MNSSKLPILTIKTHPDIARRPKSVLNALNIFFAADTATQYFLMLEKGNTVDVQFGKTQSDLAILRRNLQGQGFIIEVIPQ
jgi:hypothetical protein